MLTQWLFPAPLPGRPALGLLALRVVFGLSMSLHGLKKIKNPFHWMDKAADPAPAIFQALAAVAEFFGGLGLAAGLLTPVAAFGIVCTMLVAIRTHVAKGDGFVGGYELAALHGVVSAALLALGPGAYSVDAWIRARLTKA